jgi:hypothetical protein
MLHAGLSGNIGGAIGAAGPQAALAMAALSSLEHTLSPGPDGETAAGPCAFQGLGRG